MFGPYDVKVYRELMIICILFVKGLKIKAIYVMSTEEDYLHKARIRDIGDLWHAQHGHVNYNKLKITM